MPGYLDPGSSPSSAFRHLAIHGLVLIPATCTQWIDLPPAFHIEALSSLPLGSPLPHHLSSSGHSSPPIHRTPNKFFDSLSARDHLLSSSKHSSSTTSLVGLARESVDSGSSSGAGAKPREEHVIELQFRQEAIAVCAHYGYVVRRSLLHLVDVSLTSSAHAVLPPTRQEQRQASSHLGM